jgi:hypothetical protein
MLQPPRAFRIIEYHSSLEIKYEIEMEKRLTHNLKFCKDCCKSVDRDHDQFLVAAISAKVKKP